MKSLAVFSSLASAEPDSTGLLQTRALTKLATEDSQHEAASWCEKTDFNDWTTLCEDSDPAWLLGRRNSAEDNYMLMSSDVEVAQEDQQDLLDKLERHTKERDDKKTALKDRQDVLDAHNKKIADVNAKLVGTQQSLPDLRGKTADMLEQQKVAIVETFQADENMRKCFGDLEQAAQEEAKAKQDLADDKEEKIVTAGHLATATKEAQTADKKKKDTCDKAAAKRKLADDAAARHRAAVEQLAKSEKDLANKLAIKTSAIGEHGKAKVTWEGTVTDYDGAKKRKERECSEARDAKTVMNDQVKAYNDKVIECDKRAVASELATNFRIDAKSNLDAACGAHTAAIEANDGAKARKMAAQVEKDTSIGERDEWREILTEVKQEEALECGQADEARKILEGATNAFEKAKQAKLDAFKVAQNANATRAAKHTDKVTECSKADQDREVQTDRHRELINSGVVRDAAKELDDATGDYLKDTKDAEKDALNDLNGAKQDAKVKDDNLNKANAELKKRQDAYKKAEKDQHDAREDEKSKQFVEEDHRRTRKELTDDHEKKINDLQDNKDEFAEQEKNLKDKEDCLKRCDPANKNKKETDRADAVIAELKKATTELEAARASYKTVKKALDASTKAEADAHGKKDAQVKVHEKAKSDYAAASKNARDKEQRFKEATSAQDKAGCAQRSAQSAKDDADDVVVEKTGIHADAVWIREDAEALKKDSAAWLAETEKALQQADKDYQTAKKIADDQAKVCTTKTDEWDKAREAASDAQQDLKAKTASEACKQRTLTARTAEYNDEQAECDTMITIREMVKGDLDVAEIRVNDATNDHNRKTEQQKVTQTKEDNAAKDKAAKKSFWEEKVIEEHKLVDAFTTCNGEEENLLKEKQASQSDNATQTQQCQAAINAYKAALAARVEAKKILDTKEANKDKAIEDHSGAQCKRGRDAKDEAQKKHESDEADNTAKVNEGKCQEATAAHKKAVGKNAAAAAADRNQAAAVKQSEKDVADATKLKNDTLGRCMGLANLRNQKAQAKNQADAAYEAALCKQQEAVSRESELQKEIQRYEGSQKSQLVAAVKRYTSRLADAEAKVSQSADDVKEGQKVIGAAQAVEASALNVYAKWECALANDMRKCQSSWACVVPDQFKSGGSTVENGAHFEDECVDSTMKFQHCGGKCSASGTPDPVVCKKGVFSPTPKCAKSHDSQVEGMFSWDNKAMDRCMSDLPYGTKLSFTRGGVDLSCGYAWDGFECKDNYFGLGSGSKSPDVRFFVSFDGKVGTAMAGNIVASAYGAKNQKQDFSNGLMELDVTRHVEMPASGQWQEAVIAVPNVGFYCNFRYRFQNAPAYA